MASHALPTATSVAKLTYHLLTSWFLPSSPVAGLPLHAQALLAANDFIGLSAYGSGYPIDASQLTYRSAEIPLYTLAYELSFFGIDLKTFMDRPVLYVEQVRLMRARVED